MQNGLFSVKRKYEVREEMKVHLCPLKIQSVQSPFSHFPGSHFPKVQKLSFCPCFPKTRPSKIHEDTLNSQIEKRRKLKYIIFNGESCLGGLYIIETPF